MDLFKWPCIVISLPRHEHRRQMFSVNKAQLSNITFLDAVDGNTCTPEVLEKEYHAKINESYKDPKSGRYITKGEVGCFLSHWKVWRQIAKGDSDVTLVCEDDVMLDPTFAREATELLKAAEGGYDLLYFAYKPIDPCTPSGIDGLVYPGYTYWSCCYAITKNGAKRLLTMRPERSIIPVDEFLPMAFGKNPHKYMTPPILNSPITALASSKQLAKPSSGSNSFTEVSLGFPALQVTNRPHAITVATHQTETLNILKQSCSTYGIPLTILGMGRPWTGGNVSTGSGGAVKLHWLKEYLVNIRDDPIVIFTDAYDIFFNASMDQIITDFKHANCDVLLCAETVCWPDKTLESSYPHSETRYKYLNSGAFMGRVTDIIQMLDVAVDPNTPDDADDQLLLTKAFLSNDPLLPRMRLDTRCKVFQSLQGFDINEFAVVQEQSIIVNRHLSTRPAIFHGNGSRRTKQDFLSLSNYTTWSSFYGYKVPTCSEMTPNILVHVTARNKGFCLKECLSGLARQTYPKESLFFYLDCNDCNDDTVDILREWANEHSDQYGDIILRHNTYDLPSDVCPVDRVITERRQEVLEYARREEIPMLLSVDADAVITNPTTILELVSLKRTIAAPLLRKREAPTWSNFWGATDNNFFYKRSFDYIDIVSCNRKGVWQVPLVREVYLLDVSADVSYLPMPGDDPKLECYQRLCLRCEEKGIVPVVSNRLGISGYLATRTTFGRLHPELYGYFEQRDLWEKLYLRPEFLDMYKNRDLIDVMSTEAARDLYELKIFTNLFCDHVREEANMANLWSSGNHTDARIQGGYEAVPTVDVHLKQLGLHDIWQDFIKTYLTDIVKRLYDDLTIKGVYLSFVVRYNMQGQRSLTSHHDASVVTLNVNLSDPSEFKGSSIYFCRNRYIYNFKEKGVALLHPGRCTHKHSTCPLTGGERYTLVTFIE